MLSNLFDTAGHLVNFPLAGGRNQGGLRRARGARAYKGGLSVEPPAGSRGRAPGWGVRGAKPPKLKHFLLPNVQWKPQIRSFFWNLETLRTIKHCWILQVDFIWLITRPKLQFMWDNGGPHRIPSWAACGPRVGQHWHRGKKNKQKASYWHLFKC